MRRSAGRDVLKFSLEVGGGGSGEGTCVTEMRGDGVDEVGEERDLGV